MNESTQARVLSVFDHAVNLVNEQGEVLSVASSEVEMGPFTLSVSEFAFPEHVDETSSVESNLDMLRIGEVSFLLVEPVLWNPRPHWESLHAQNEKIRDGLEVVKAGLQSSAPEGSLAALLEGFSSSSDLPGTIIEAARKPSGDLLEGLLVDNRDLLLNGARALAGLGGGLTPAGDDWIVGCILAIHILRDASDAIHLCSAIVDEAAPRTTTLSAAWMRAAVEGACSERWHVLFSALLEGEGILQAAKDLAHLGHTSGADALAGFVASLEGFFTPDSPPS